MDLFSFFPAHYDELSSILGRLSGEASSRGTAFPVDGNTHIPQASHSNGTATKKRKPAAFMTEEELMFELIFGPDAEERPPRCNPAASTDIATDAQTLSDIAAKTVTKKDLEILLLQIHKLADTQTKILSLLQQQQELQEKQEQEQEHEEAQQQEQEQEQEEAQEEAQEQEQEQEL